MARLPKTKEAGREWAAKARAEGFRVSGGGGVLTLSREFEAGDRDAYVATECAAFSLICEAPTVGPGSTWGSTSDGIGGHVALSSGSFTLKRSGVSKNFAAGV